MPSYGSIRYCKEIGLWAIDRGRGSCKHQSDFCKLYCYNIPIYNYRGKRMLTRDKINDKF